MPDPDRAMFNIHRNAGPTAFPVATGQPVAASDAHPARALTPPPGYPPGYPAGEPDRPDPAEPPRLPQGQWRRLPGSVSMLAPAGSDPHGVPGPGVAAAAHLPAPLTLVGRSRLAPSAQCRVGVARFPQPEVRTDDIRAADPAYGLRFCRATHTLADRLRSGQLADLDGLWMACRAERTAWVSEDDPRRPLFAAGRTGTDLQSATPVRDRYAYLARRLFEDPDQPRVTEQKQVKASGVLTWRPFEKMERTATLALPSGARFELTRVTAHTRPDGRPAYVASGPGRLRAGDMHHTSPDLVPALMHVAQQRFAEIVAGRDATPAATLQRLAGLHWLLAHTMPDFRGSAAKAELAVRALALSQGLELPPFRDGVVPDLEAFLMDEAAFRQRHAGMLEGEPVPL